MIYRNFAFQLVLIIALFIGGNAFAKKQTVKVPQLPCMIELGSEKCRPCKMMAPIIEELKKEYKGILYIKFIDVWKKENLPQAQKYKIKSIPTQIFLDEKGKELWRHVGFISKKDILKKWKSLGYDFAEIKKQKKVIKSKK